MLSERCTICDREKASGGRRRFPLAICPPDSASGFALEGRLRCPLAQLATRLTLDQENLGLSPCGALTKAPASP